MNRKRSIMFSLLNLTIIIVFFLALISLIKDLNFYIYAYRHIFGEEAYCATAIYESLFMSLMIFYIVFLYLKEKKSFLVWFVVGIILNIAFDIFLMNDTSFAHIRILFHIISFVVFTIYSFSKESKQIFVN